MAWGGDGAFFDIGFGLLSGSWERAENILHVCFDNEAYMNCLSCDSLIMTVGGLKKITDLLIGEMVYAFSEHNYGLVLKRCTRIFNNGIKKVYEVSTLHHSIKATANHPFLIVNRRGRGKTIELKWKKLEELKRGDEVIVSKKMINEKSYQFPKINLIKSGDYKVNKINKTIIPTKSSPELMEFLGLFIGDGWIRTERGEIGFALPKGSAGRERLKALSQKVFDSRVNDNDKNYIYIYSVNLANFIEILGLGKGAKNKIIPSWIFTLPLAEKEALLKGLMLSDGYCVGKSQRYVSASFILLRTLRLLLQTMGYRVGKIHQQIKKKGTFCVYRQLLEDSSYGCICFSKQTAPNIVKYLSQSKQRDFLVDNKYWSSEKIVAIKFIKEEPTIDLQIEGAHNFVADGIIVHNTGVQASGATPFGANTTTTPPDTDSFGNQLIKKDMLAIALAHRCVYVATASIGNVIDIENKVKKALGLIGPKYLQILTSCVPGWYIDSKDTIKVARLAQQTGIYPIVEFVNGKQIDAVKCPSLRPKVEEYLKLQGRYKHLFKSEAGKLVIARIQKIADENVERYKL
jgi:pyruvate/2-oxoacid:ferredoxin oxidoreductase beta subunit